MNMRNQHRHRAALAAAFFLILTSCGGAAESPVETGPLSVTAMQLGEAYAASEAQAQARYGNRDLVVTGTVTLVTTDPANNAVIRMKGSDELHDVFLTLFEGEKARAQHVEKGSRLTLRCEGATLVIGSPTLDGCTFAENSGS